MDDDHHVSGGNEPPGLLQCDENVVSNAVAEGPVADQCDGEVANGNDDVGNEDALPHRFLGWLLRRGGDGGLDLQDDVVAGVSERYVSQSSEEAEDGT